MLQKSKSLTKSTPRFGIVSMLLTFTLGVMVGFHLQSPLQPATTPSSTKEQNENSNPSRVDDNDSEDPKHNSVSKDRVEKSFTELLRESGSDKYFRHHYERYYKNWLEPLRHKVGLRFLEIGADEGKSLDMWKSYFSSPEYIIGLAYRNAYKRLVESGKRPNSTVEVIYGDQSKASTMKTLKTLGPWDCIIDDGSHVPKHVVYTLFELWPSIVPGGMYVIEDVATSYWQSGLQIYGYRINGTGFMAGPKDSAVAKLKLILDILPRKDLGLKDFADIPFNNLCSMEWGMGLVVLRKCGPDDGPGEVLHNNVRGSRDVIDWRNQFANSNPKKDEEGNLL